MMRRMWLNARTRQGLMFECCVVAVGNKGMRNVEIYAQVHPAGALTRLAKCDHGHAGINLELQHCVADLVALTAKELKS